MSLPSRGDGRLNDDYNASRVAAKQEQGRIRAARWTATNLATRRTIAAPEGFCPLTGCGRAWRIHAWSELRRHQALAAAGDDLPDDEEDP